MKAFTIYSVTVYSPPQYVTIHYCRSKTNFIQNALRTVTKLGGTLYFTKTHSMRLQCHCKRNFILNDLRVYKVVD